MTQLLRRLAFFLGRREDLHRAAGLLDGRDRGLRGAVHFDVELGLELAAAEQPQATLGAAQHASLDQGFDVHHAAGVDLLGIDRILEPVEIDLGELDAEDVVEAALGQTAMQGHLAAFETLDAHARTRGLALATAAGLLALARTNAAADAHTLLARAGIVGDIAELHRPAPCFLRMTFTENGFSAFRDRAPLLTSRRRCERDGELSRSCHGPPGCPAVRWCGRSC